MDRSLIERLFAVGDPEEAGALLVGFGTQLGNFKKLLAAVEGAVFLAVAYDIFRRGLFRLFIAL